MSGAVAIIPARLDSTRFPRKVLAAETGRPMIQHVVDRAVRAESIGRVVVAADDPQIVDAVSAFATECVLTSREHPNGTSRLDEAAERLKLDPDQIIVNVQGDEPQIEPRVIDAAVDALRTSRERMSTVASAFDPGEDPADPNIVKVVTRRAGDGVRRAVYFSRACIPYHRDGGAPASAPLKHVGLYAYRRDFLGEYVAMAPTPLEQTEQLEQLRAVEHGVRIAVALERAVHHGIDTPEQYAAFVARWRANSAD